MFDYTSMFGIGYLYEDLSVGVFFNDLTSVWDALVYLSCRSFIIIIPRSLLTMRLSPVPTMSWEPLCFLPVLEPLTTTLKLSIRRSVC